MSAFGLSRIQDGAFSKVLGGGSFARWGGGPTKLLALDYTQPVQQAFPTTAAGLAALIGATPELIFDCSETSGNLVDEISGETLVPTNSPIQGRAAVGFFNGTDMHSHKCVEFKDAGTGHYIASNANIANIGSAESYAVLVVFRTTEVPGSNRGICGTNFASDGWEIQVRTNGHVRVNCADSDDTDFDLVADTGTAFADGTWQAVLWVLDRTGAKHHIYGTWNVTDPAAAITVGNIAQGNNFHIGDEGANGPVQVKYVATFRGAQVESLGQSNVDTFWTHGSDPGTGGIFPQLDTYARASMACPIVGNEAGFGVRVAKSQTTANGGGSWAYGWRSGLTHTTKLGLLIEDAATNLQDYSEDVSHANWSKTNATVTANDAEAPDGSQTADKITADANDGRVQGNGVSLAVSTEYTLSVFIKRVGGSDVTGRLIFWDSPAEVAAVAYTATSEWQRITLTATTTAADFHNIRLEIDTSGEAVHVWGFQMEAGGHASSYIPTKAASATRVKADCRLTNTAEEYLKGNQGEIHAVWSSLYQDGGAARHILDAHAGSNANRALIRFGVDEATDFIVWDSASVIKANIAEGVGQTYQDEEADMRCRWDSVKAGIDSYIQNSDAIINGTRTAGQDNTWTMTGSGTTLYIGQSNAASEQLDGVIATLDIYDAPRAEVV